MDTRTTDSTPRQELVNALHEARKELTTHYESLALLMKRTSFYRYQIQKYSAYLEHNTLNATIPGTPTSSYSQTPYIIQNGSEYYSYSEKLKTLLQWWSKNEELFDAYQSALQTLQPNAADAQHNAHHMTQCFQALDHEWALWDQIEECLNSHKDAADAPQPQYYCLLAQLAYNHQAINRLFSLDNTDFDLFLNRHMNRHLTHTINEYVTSYFIPAEQQ